MSIVEKSQQQLSNKLPFVLYRKPNSKGIQGFFQKNDILFATESYKTSGFIFAPFDSESPTYIFPFKECDIVNEEFKEVVLKSSNLSSVGNNSSKENHINLVKK